MKKILAGLIGLVLAVPAIAQHRHGPYHPHYGHRHGPTVIYRDNWVGPLVGGVVLGAIIAEANKPTVVQQQPVIVQQPPIVLQPANTVCTEWKEIITSDGKMYKERTCREL